MREKKPEVLEDYDLDAAATSAGRGTRPVYPDVCKIPAPPAPFVPIPYPNVLQNSFNGKDTPVAMATKDSFDVVTDTKPKG